MRSVRLRELWPPLAGAALFWLALPGGGGLWPLLFVALLPLLRALRGATGSQAVRLGLLGGFCHFLLQLYWIVIVLARYGGVAWPLALGALFLLALYMALYWLLFLAAARRLLHWQQPVTVLLALPSLWVGLDWLRAWLLTGFPWMDLGYGLVAAPWLLQSADLWGHYGLTWLIVLVNVFLAQWFWFTERRPMGWRLAVLLPLLLTLAYGGWRTMTLPQVVAQADTFDVGLVQGNIEQDMKWSVEWQQETVERYVAASRRLSAEQQLDMLLWPEAALPFYPIDHELLAPVRDLSRTSGLPLLTGAPWYEVDPLAEQLRYYNSALIQDETGSFVARYDKGHLVPFGEYVPLRRLLFFFRPLVETIGDFTPGGSPKALTCGPASIGVLICFESIFPELARKQAVGGANLLVNLTNDAWYGRSSAPWQGLAMARLRAVENRRALLRAANTGVSALIDPMGRLTVASPLFEPWAATVAAPLLEGRTLYVAGGWSFAPLSLCAGILVLGLALARGAGRRTGQGRRLEMVSWRTLK